MNTIVEILGSHLLDVAEKELVKSEPVIQDAIMSEMQSLLVKVDAWIQDKITATIKT